MTGVSIRPTIASVYFGKKAENNLTPLKTYLYQHLGADYYAHLQFQQDGVSRGVNRVTLSASHTPVSAKAMDAETQEKLFHMWQAYTGLKCPDGQSLWDKMNNGKAQVTIDNVRYEISVANAFMPPDWRPGGAA